MRILVAIGLVLLAAPAQASAWDGKQRLTEAGPHPFTVAGNEHGRRVVAWADNTGVYLTVAPRGGRFGRVRKVAGAPRKFGVQAGVDAHGNVAVTWQYDTQEVPPGDDEDDEGCCRRLMGALLSRDGRLSHPVMLGFKGVDNRDPLLNVQSDGRIGFAFWSQQVMYARFGTTRAGFGPLVRMSSDAGLPLSVRDGRVVYVRYDVSQSTVEVTKGSERRHVVHDDPILMLGSDDRGRQTGVWGSGLDRLAIGFRRPPNPFARPALDRRGWALAFDVAGSGAVAVLCLVEEGANADPSVFAVLRPPGGGAFRAPVRVAGNTYPFESDVAAGPDGGAAVGSVVRAGSDYEARVSLIPRAGTKARQLVAVRGLDVQEVRVLRDARGPLVVAATDRGLAARWMR